MNDFLVVHQEKREKAKDQIDKFLFENKWKLVFHVMTNMRLRNLLV
jgi:hypothetical protein